MSDAKLLDELARCFMRAALEKLLGEEAEMTLDNRMSTREISAACTNPDPDLPGHNRHNRHAPKGKRT